MMVRIFIGIDEQLDCELAAAAAERGDAGQSTFDEMMNEALTQFLEDAPIIEECGSLNEEDWELETPSGHFHICGGRAEPAPGTETATISQILAIMFKEVQK